MPSCAQKTTPRTVTTQAQNKEAAWKFVRGQALLIAESGNLLLLRPPHNAGATVPTESRRPVFTTVASWEPTEKGPVVDGVTRRRLHRVGAGREKGTEVTVLEFIEHQLRMQLLGVKFDRREA